MIVITANLPFITICRITLTYHAVAKKLLHDLAEKNQEKKKIKLFRISQQEKSTKMKARETMLCYQFFFWKWYQMMHVSNGAGVPV